MPAHAPFAPSFQWIAWLGFLSIIGLIGHWVWVFGFTPADIHMGFVQKIMYIHVPTIYAGYLSFFVVFACSIAYIWKRDATADRIATACCEIGLLFTGMGLFSGAVWGKPTWGTYWVWDARLTSTLALFLVYAGYALLRMMGDENARMKLLAAVIGIVGFLDIPLIHLSVRWWRTLHQPSSLFRATNGVAKVAMPLELLAPLLTGMVVATLWWLFLLLVRLRAQHEKTLWENALKTL